MKRSTYFILMIALMICIVGCDDKSETISTPGAVLTMSADKGAAEIPSLELLDSLEYEEFSGTILPGLGAMLLGEMTTWTSGSYFAITIPPNAVPDNGGAPVEFSMRIPTRQSYLDHADDNLPLIIRLQPANINFAVPVTVMGTYMPWERPKLNGLYEYYCIDPDPSDPLVVPSVYLDGRMLRVMFPAPHFSLWAVGDNGT